MTARLPAVWLLLSAISCGGGTSSRPAETAAGDGEGRQDESGAEPEDGDESAAAESEAPRRQLNCDDGTCTPCGQGLCMAGWYCDESAKGGPACGWLPECAKASCACLSRAFSSCSCEEKSGGVHLTCG
jgi:hypothetical protein